MPNQDHMYKDAAQAYSSALDRLARAYEADPEERRDLLQDIHLGLWRSFQVFDARCSLRTWVYRVVHNIATSHVIRQRRKNSTLMTLESADSIPAEAASQDERPQLERLMALIRNLKPPDRQLMLLYLEGIDAGSIGEITGMSASNVSTKVHRIKKLLAQYFQKGERHAG